MALLRYKYYDKHSKIELIEMMKVEKDHKKQTEIAHAITYHIIDEKRESGNLIQTDNYSGRQSKRR